MSLHCTWMTKLLVTAIMCWLCVHMLALLIRLYLSFLTLSYHVVAAACSLPDCMRYRFLTTSASSKTLSNTDGLCSTTAMTVLCEFTRREDLPMPWGFILTSVFMITSCELLFGFGRRLHLMFMHQQQLANMAGGVRRPRTRLENGDDACPSVDAAHVQMTSSDMRHRLHQNTG